jgi:hypothetical protein
MTTSSSTLTSVITAYKAVGRLARKLPLSAAVAKSARLRARHRLLQAMPRNSVCAEIGVWKGDFTQMILDVVQPSMLHLIDPWHFDETSENQWFGGRSEQAQTQSDMESIYRAVTERYGKLPNVAIHRETSSSALARFGDESLDWVYIDGNHSYDFVHADLWGYLPKVRPGGFLTGDDYWWGPEENLPVKRAVDEMVATGRAELRYLQRGQFILRKVR